jgi:hypothetical protein
MLSSGFMYLLFSPLAFIFSTFAMTDFFLFKTLRKNARQFSEKSIEREKKFVYWFPLIITTLYFSFLVIAFVALYLTRDL